MKKHTNKYAQPKTFFMADATLDYHDRGVLLPYDIEKLLSEFLEDSYNLGHKQVLIITGKGLVVRPLVEKLLARNKYVTEFTQASFSNGHKGAFEVNLA
jgi:DNA-nicking Smr family endonuclease